MLTPDVKVAKQFLNLLDADGIHTFQSIGEGAAKGVLPSRVMHGTAEAHETVLAELNGRGAGIFVMVNRGDGRTYPGANTCRTAQSVTEVRALFVDLDGAPIEPVLDSGLLPDWIVQSSPGRWHAYWKVSLCPRDEFSNIQAALATRFNGDASVKDLPRVMRIPGFIHRKADPVMSQLFIPSEYSSLPARSA